MTVILMTDRALTVGGEWTFEQVVNRLSPRAVEAQGWPILKIKHFGEEAINPRHVIRVIK